ncbi:MAG: phage holin [Bacteroidales bacterium]|nr:phage holin [Bacteroidales bacterium]
MTNKVYDVLKWIALVGLPAITTLYLTLATIWGFPYAEAIGATMGAVDVFLGAVLGISSISYARSNKE